MKPKPVSSPLPRSTLEEVGIPSRAVSAFVDALERCGQEVHSFMLLRHGHVAAEAWWKPYDSALPHLLFSLSKSFTSAAVGFAVAEGRLNVDDAVLTFFPEEAPRRPSANLAAMRVRHLLTMTTGHAKAILQAPKPVTTRNWLKAIFALPVDEQPGSRFVYNSLATYLLSAIVQRLTGQRLLDYLGPRLWQPLGIEGATWETCPRGIDAGGWGLAIRTEDIAKFGQLLLAKGRWGDRQLLPASWVEEATRRHVPNDDGQSPDWRQGYGYQFWRCRFGCYRGDGAFGQFCLVMPEQDAVLAVTAGASDMQAILEAVWQALLPDFGAKAPVVKKHQADLRRRIRSLSLDPPPFQERPQRTAALDGSVWHLEPNEAKVRFLAFALRPGRLVLSIQGRRKTVLRLGQGRWAAGRTRRDGASAAEPVRAAYAWTADDTLEATVRYIVTPFRVVYAVRFAGDKLELTIRWNVSFGPTELPPIKGSRVDGAGAALADRGG